ncbi:MAG TPA: ATP-grasp domain-containing protein [Methanoregula sp.]|nr:ATP-grasp domain-containing protein [Methanoregula sp.]
MKGRVLVAGFATRHVAQSASRAGYEVCAVDHFCDQDLAWYTSDRIRFEDLSDLPDAIDTMAKRHPFDLFVATSGAEDLPTTLPLCGTSPGKVARFLDKLEIQHFFEKTGIPVPRIVPDGTYPAMIKPRRGAGGWRNGVIRSDAERHEWELQNPGMPFILQELVPGIPASVSCIADGKRARAVAVNEQLLRGGLTRGSYGFCGSVTPFSHPAAARMAAIAENVAAQSGCTGSVGIDFMADGDDVWTIEINPRFQGTVDTVERATGCSLFQFHVDACSGVLPAPVPAPQNVSVRSILFADRDITVGADLSTLAPAVADIPWPGTFFEQDQAVVSVFGEGPTRQDALAVLDKHIRSVLQYIR